METKTLIAIRIRVKTDVGEYNDTLYYTEAEYAKTSQSDVEAKAQARADAWVSAVQNPAPVVEPTKAELQQQENELSQTLDAVRSKIQEIDAK